ncbi:MAG TPA: hypothetical protein VFZ52_06570 [Chryseolinea sp.]
MAQNIFKGYDEKSRRAEAPRIDRTLGMLYDLAAYPLKKGGDRFFIGL